MKVQIIADDNLVKEKNGLFLLRRGKEYTFTISECNICLSSVTICLIMIKNFIPKSHQINLLDEKVQNSWECKLFTKNNETFIHLNIPDDANVGDYRVQLKEKKQLIGRVKFFVICNPFSPKDQSYLSNTEEIHEYVYSDYTKIFIGGKDHIYSKHWNLDIFDFYVLKGVRFLVRNIHVKEKNTFWNFCKDLTSLISSVKFKQGILVGNWTSDYKGGRNPLHWCSTGKIFRKYVKNNYKPVKFAHCWVYAGVVCSIFRLLGVACRIVSNFESYNDKDGSLLCNVLVDEINKDTIFKDRIWNFRVWNEIWLNNKEEKFKIFDGWHVIDATNQDSFPEKSQVGPIPVYAIKEGCIQKHNDINYAFSQIYGDRLYLLKFDGQKKIINLDIDSIGKVICTKEIGTDNKQIINDCYKNPVGSSKRIVIVKEILQGYKELSENMEFVIGGHIKIESEKNVLIGNKIDVHFTVDIENVQNKPMFYIMINLTDYSKNLNKLIYFQSTKPKEYSFKSKITIDTIQYLDKIKNAYSYIIIKAFHLDIGRCLILNEKTVIILHPEMKINVPTSVKVGVEFQICIKFIDNIDMCLKNVTVYLDAAFLKKRASFHLNNINLLLDNQIRISLICKDPGTFYLMSWINCDSYCGSHAVAELIVI